jgi:hypothetical protein
MDLTSYCEKAICYDDYVEKLGDNCALHQLHYKKFAMPAEVEQTLKQMKPLKVLVLTEPWCGDSLAIFPVVRKIAEINDWEIKVLLRDENLDLMERFLTRNARAVPIFLFLAPDCTLLFKFGPRPTAAQDIFESHRDAINAGEIEKKEVTKKIRNFYAKDRGKAILEQLLDIFKEKDLI